MLKALREAQAGEVKVSPGYLHIQTQIIPALRRELQALMAWAFHIPDLRHVYRSDVSYTASYIAAAVAFPEVSVPVSANTGESAGRLFVLGVTRLRGDCSA